MSEKGFTLVELLVAILASLIVLGAIAATFIIQDRSYNRESQVVDVQENARAGMHMITQLLAMAGYDPTGTAGAGLVTAASDEIRFTMDLNGSGVIGDEITGEADEDITFALDTTDLQLTMDNQPLAENIPPDGLVFSYFDSSDNQLSTPLTAEDRASVTRVTIQLSARTQDPDPDYPGGYRTRTLTSEVLVANLAFGGTPTATTTVGTTTEGTTSEGTSTETPTTEKPTTETPTTEKPTTETPTTEKPTTEKPSTEKPMTEKPTTEKPTTEKPTTEKPTTEKPSTEKPTTETPSTEKPTTEKPTTETSTTETSTTGGETTAPTTTEPPDTTGPAITNITQVPDSSQILNNTDVVVQADITDPSGVAVAILFTDRDPRITMTSGGGDRYEATIPNHNNSFTTYFIYAQDAAPNPNETTSDSYTYEQGPFF
jgi:prepilin-type N-terminal cleavage/methylation domain-containing protein